MDEILVAMDDSPAARAALEYALEQFPDATIRVVTVPEASAFPVDTGTTTADMADEEAQDVLAKAESIAEEYDLRIETDTVYGHPAKAVIEYATDHDVDQIVVGSRGRSGAKRLLLGSVAETIVRRASCPVVVVR